MQIKLYPMLKKGLLAVTTLLSVGTTASAQPWLPYCQPTYSSGPCQTPDGLATQILEVKTTGGTTNINNPNNTCNTSNGYSYYSGTGNTLIANAGSTIVCSVKVDKASCNTSDPYGYRVLIWLDWNRTGASKGVFDNATYNATTNTGELFYQTSTADPCGTTSSTGGQYWTGATSGGALVIPATAKEGWTRLRVRAGVWERASSDPLGITRPPDGGATSSPCHSGASGRVHKNGEVEDYDVYIVNPCLMNPVNIDNVKFNGFRMRWNRRKNAEMYEYFISDTLHTNTPPNGWNLTADSAVSFPNANYPSIECDKKYYIYTRTICDTADLNQNDWATSPWRIDSVTTPPCCYTPEVTITNVTSTTAIASWTPVPSVYKYEYLVSMDTVPPSGAKPGIMTISTGVPLQGLDPGRMWYFFLRAYCNPTPTSEWSVDSFLTKPPTGVPQVAGKEFGIIAYPNPVKDVVTLELAKGIRSGKAKVIVTDITGKVVTTAEMEKEVLELNLSGKPAGTYIIKYADDAHTDVIHVSKQ
ncbi:MAG TPA: T9SS type A sorting domain-containing protein [Flavipsychrobacter sp.]